MTARHIIGFDLGSHMGWAHLEAGERLASGTWHLGTGRARWATARKDINMLIVGILFESNVDEVIVAYERITWACRAPAFAAVYFGLVALIESATLEQGVACFAILPQHWKDHAVGHGNATKPEYIEAANTRYGLRLDAKGEDEAAALGVAYGTWRNLGGGEQLATNQQGSLL